MHRFQSKSTITRLRFAASLVVVKWILAPLASGILILALIRNDHPLILVAAYLGGLAILSIIIQWAVAGRARCPLCMAPVLAVKKCAKHSKARKFIGSHRLRVSMEVLCKGSFRCPYCNEPSILEVRAGRR